MFVQLYQTIYLLFVALLTFFVSQEYTPFSSSDIKKRNISHKSGALLLCVILILYIGLRPIDIRLGDTWAYYLGFLNYDNQAFTFTWEADNFLFDNLYSFIIASGFGVSFFFVIISTFYFVFIYEACKKLFPNDTLLAFLVYLAAFSTYSYGVNGIKAGAAASLFLVAVAFFDRKVFSAIFLFFSLGFHHSMILPIVAFVLTFFYRKKKYYLLLWLFCLVIAALHITYFQSVFYGLTSEKGQGYLELTNYEKAISGFRIDFIIYSVIPIIFGYWFTAQEHLQYKAYDFLWCVYTLCNAVWLLCVEASYSNRIAYLSWLLYPFVLLYPVIVYYRHYGRRKFLTYVVFGHLAFTLFMHFVYYG